MISLDLIHDPKTLQAAGAVAVAHGQLEHIMCMTVKSLSGMSINDALVATSNMKAWELRESIKKLFNQKTTEEKLRLKMRAILTKAKDISEKRNKLIHRPWAIDKSGQVVVKDANHTWGPPPTSMELQVLAGQIRDVAFELNTARLKGFIKDIIDKSK